MSESKQREAREAQETPHERLLRELSRAAAQDGKLIEMGWLSLRAVWLHPDAPPDQVKLARWAFMAGAQHLFASIMTVLDPDDKVTEGDMHKMELISAELDAFTKEVNRSLPTEGQG